jgi:hypothetical protein
MGAVTEAGPSPGSSHASHTSSSNAWCFFKYETSESRMSGVCDTTISGPPQSALDLN